MILKVAKLLNVETHRLAPQTVREIGRLAAAGNDAEQIATRIKQGWKAEGQWMLDQMKSGVDPRNL